jgi:hypothetical protein
MKYNGKANCNIYITWIFNIEKTLIVFSHVEQPTKSFCVVSMSPAVENALSLGTEVELCYASKKNNSVERCVYMFYISLFN